MKQHTTTASTKGGNEVRVRAFSVAGPRFVAKIYCVTSEHGDKFAQMAAVVLASDRQTSVQSSTPDNLQSDISGPYFLLSVTIRRIVIYSKSRTRRNLPDDPDHKHLP
jgi:hypothetical protein